MEETRLRNWNLQLFADEGDKTEEPTPHRLREARRRGQVFKSIELNSALNMLGMALLFMVAGKAAYGSFMEMMQAYLGDLFIQSAAGLNQSGVTLSGLPALSGHCRAGFCGGPGDRAGFQFGPGGFCLYRRSYFAPAEPA